MIGLSVSIVSYFHELPVLDATLDSLAQALTRLAQTDDLVTDLILVDNSEDGRDEQRLRQWLQARAEPHHAFARVRLQVTGANVGYGRANNAAQSEVDPVLDAVPHGSRWVLILNPDVVLAADSLTIALASMRAAPQVSMLCPRALDAGGNDLYLAHRYPSFTVLALRAIAPARPGRWLTRIMHRYECRDLPPDQPHQQTLCASGCFMLMSHSSWQRSGGFDPSFFLYFEDYDLSCRLLTIGPVLYEPSVRIEHAGGQAATKSALHRKLFIKSALLFFWRNGWPRLRLRAIRPAEPAQ